MAYIDKLLGKFSKVKQAINSLKGIQAKIQAINYTTAMDALGEEKAKAEELLNARRSSLEKSIGSQAIAGNYVKDAPTVDGQDLVYPIYDKLTNYIVFVSRPRRKRPEASGSKAPIYTRRQVALYVPDAVISQATVSYQADGVNNVARALNEVVEAWDRGGASDAWEATKEQSNKVATKFIQQTLNTMTGGLSNLKRGRAINPMQEQMLNGIPFRSWDFTFDFWPKSAAEATNVRNIIYFFRSSMLPDVYSEVMSITDEDGKLVMPHADDVQKGQAAAHNGEKFNAEVNASYFNYPNVFEIFFEGPLGDKVDGFLPAVCTNAQVDYTGGQKFSTFADGQPVHIQLTLNFLEIKTMTLGNYEAIKASELTLDGKNKGTGDPGQNMSIVDRASRGDYSDEPPPGT